MLDENARKTVALEYCRRINGGDVEDVLALFSDRPFVEDPVGGGEPFTDRASYRRHIKTLIEASVQETPGTPVATPDDEHVALPITVLARPPQVAAGTAVRMDVIAVMRIGADGLIHHMRVFSGRTDMKLVPVGPGGNVGAS